MVSRRDYTNWLSSLFQQHHDMLLRIARIRLNCYDDSFTEAEDVIQDVFVKALEKDISKEEKPVGWLIVTTNNICKNRYRRHMSNTAKEKISANQLIVNQPSHYTHLTEGAQDDEAEAIALDLSLQQELTEEEYRLLREHCIEGESLANISNQDGMTTGALRTRLNRLRKKARNIFLLILVTVWVLKDM